ncbi:MAG TPA: hypothetical protein EYP55_08620 [Anaerolineae bacterium]|nr:hypothetical protein [Anaerolineae bacterium]
MRVRLEKELPSGERHSWELILEQVDDKFRLLQVVRGESSQLARGSRSDVMSALAMVMGRLRAAGYGVVDGDEEYRRLHPGQFQTKLAPELREALDIAGIGHLPTPAVARSKLPLGKRRPRSRAEALRLGVK